MHKKVSALVTSRAQYGRIKLLLEILNNDPAFDLQIITAGSAMLHNYGNILDEFTRDGFERVDQLYISVEGGDNIAMAKTTGMAITECTTAFQQFDPDLILINGDRFEVLGAAIAAAYTNRIIAHMEGGDVSGTIDESVRHAVTKLSHIHFVSNEISRQRILKMGEDPSHTHVVGSVDIEFLNHAPDITDLSFVNEVGVGHEIDFSSPFTMVMQHPVTTGEDNETHIGSILNAVEELDIQTIWFWPNIDAGTGAMSQAIRRFRERNHDPRIRFIVNLLSQQFINLLRRTSCLVGNSSAGIKECSYLGIPVVNIGSRQQGRLRADNVLDTDYDIESIKQGIESQLNHGVYPLSSIYYRENTSQTMADILRRATPSVQKRFLD